MATQSEKPAKAAKKRSPVKIVLLVLVLVVVALGLLVFFLPSILSSGSGKSFLLGKVNATIAGEVRIEALKLSWFGGQSVSGFQLLDSAGNTVVTFDRLQTGASIWGILMSKQVDLGDTRLDALVARVDVDESGESNLQRAVAPRDGTAAPGDTPSSPTPDRPSPPGKKEPARIPIPITGNLSIPAADIVVSGAGFETVTVNPLDVDLSIDPARRALDFTVAAAAKQGSLAGRLDAKGAVTDFVAADGALTPEKAVIDIEATAADFPVPAIDHLAGMKGLLTAALASPLDLAIEAKSGLQDGVATISINTPNLNVDVRTTIQNNRLALAEPGSLRFSLTPGLVDHLLRESGQAKAASLDAAVPIAVELRSLGLPLGGFQPADTAVDLGLTAGDVRIRSASFGRVAVRNLAASLSSEDLTDSIAVSLKAVTEQEGASGNIDITGDLRRLLAANGALQLDKADTRADIALRDLPVAALAALAGVDAAMAGMIGPRMTLTANARRDADAIQATLEVASNGLQARLPLTFTESLRLASPGSIRLTVDPDLFLDSPAGNSPPCTLNVDLKTLDIPFPKGAMQLAGTKLDVAIASERVAIDLGKPLNLVSLNNLAASVRGESLSALEIQAGALVRSGQAEAPLTVNGNIRNLMGAQGMTLDRMTAALDIAIEDMNPDPWSAILDQPPLGALFGERLDIAAKINLPGGLKGKREASVQAKSDLLTLSGAFDLTEALIRNTAPIEAAWRLTPAGYQAYRRFTAKDAPAPSKPETVRLAAPADMTLRIDTLRWPLGESTDFKPSDAGLVARADIPALSLHETERNVTAALEDFSVNIQGPDLSKPLKAALSGNILLPGESGARQMGRLSLDAEIADLLLAGGIVNTTGMQVQANVSANQVPVDGLDVLLGAEEMLSAAFGESLNAAVQARMRNQTGTVTAQVDSENARADAALAMAPEAITLSKPITAQAEVTPDMGRVLLSKVNPLLVTAIGAENPIRLTVDHRGFRVPTGENAVAGTQVQAATVELGRILLSNGNVLGALLSFLKSDSRSQITADFTPLKARVIDGVAHYDRMDIILSDTQRLATWGTIDLVRDEVDMVLGLTATTLDKIFNVEGLDPDHVLEIPMRGKTSDVKVDWGAATTRIARLVAAREIDKAAPGVGGLLQGILGGGGGTAPPAPKTTPRPGTESAPAGDAGSAETGSEAPVAAPTAAPEPAQGLGGLLQGILGGGGGTAPDAPAPVTVPDPAPEPAQQTAPETATESGSESPQESVPEPATPEAEVEPETVPEAEPSPTPNPVNTILNILGGNR